MKCKVGIGLALTAAVAAGCNAPAETIPVPAIVEQPNTIPPHAVEVKTQLPDHLPHAVQEAARAAVSVQVNHRTTLESSNLQAIESGFGSGVRIDNEHALTAGHVGYMDTGTMKPDAVFCQGVNLNVPTVATNGERGSGANVDVLSMAGSFKASEAIQHPADSPDIAILRTAPNTPEGYIAPAPAIQFRSTPVKAGDAVYFVGYPPDMKSGIQRSPDQRDLPSAERERLATPAMYGGIVLKDQTAAGETLSILTDVQSYGAVDHRYSIRGDSGEAVFDAEGHIVGITSKSNPDMPMELQQFNGYLDVQAEKVARDYDPAAMRFSLVQSVDAALVRRLIHASDAAPPCKPYK